MEITKWKKKEKLKIRLPKNTREPQALSKQNFKIFQASTVPKTSGKTPINPKKKSRRKLSKKQLLWKYEKFHLRKTDDKHND